MRQKICRSIAPDAGLAIQEICQALGTPDAYDVILFCSSTKYDFTEISAAMHERFPDCEVMGTTTCGEISPAGFTDNGIVAAGISCPNAKVASVIVDKASDFLYVRRDELERAASSCGIRAGAKDAFALTFICALYNAEENVLAFLHAVLGNDFFIAGGSAGDDLKFARTSVSCNGKVVSDGAAIMLFRTNEKFTIYRENIFKSTGRAVNITKADPEKRIILSIDSQNPLKRYSELIGVSEKEVKENMDYQIMGRVFGDNIFVSSMQSFNEDGTINLYSRVLPNTHVEALEIVNPLEVVHETCDRVLSEIPRPGFIFMSNCIQRTIRFKNMGIDTKLRDIYKSRFPCGFFGFTTYGEQINRIHANSTLVILAVEEN